MPKLPSNEAAAVNETEVQSFAPIPPGLYPLRLLEVKVGEGKKGPYWSWEYEIPDGYDYARRRFWNNTSLSEASRFKMKEAFAAHGVPADTDTDELVGTWVTGRIGIRTIQAGERAGDQANTITELLPFKEEDFPVNEGEQQYDEEPF